MLFIACGVSFRVFFVGCLFWLLPLDATAFSIVVVLIGHPLYRLKKTYSAYKANNTFKDESNTLGIWPLKMNITIPPNWTSYGQNYKNQLGTLPKNHFNRLKFFQVTEGSRIFSDPSRGSQKLRIILQYLECYGRKTVGNFVDLCAGAGGWSQVMHNRKMTGEAYSFWDEREGHESWSGPQIKLHPGDYRQYEPVKGKQWILFDGGESYPDYNREERDFFSLFSKVEEWIIANPRADFVIKILSPSSPRIHDVLRRIQTITGKGELVRLFHSRLTSHEMYFVSSPAKDTISSAVCMYQRLIQLVNTPVDMLDETNYSKYESIGVPKWTAEADMSVPLLPPYDMTNGIRECVKNVLQAPRNITRFLKEVGYFKSTARGSSTTFYNMIIKPIVEVLVVKYPDIQAWKTTSTTSHSIQKVVSQKIDVAPVENHQHWDYLKEAYATLSEFMIQRGGKMRRLTTQELIKSLNPQGTMGIQEDNFEENGIQYSFKTIKEYASHMIGGRYLWQSRVKKIRKSFEANRPILSVFNTVAKTEKKMDVTRHKDKASRLIWFLPATMRIFEAEVFGCLEELLTKIPYTVSGTPLYDYGDQLAEIFFKKKNRKAICNDIAGWDTRISKGLQRLECWFLNSLTKDECLKQDITHLYRLYSNATVMIARDSNDGDETAIYQLRGQVASGRRPTYAMNTITNIIVSMCAAAKSQDIPLEKLRVWMLTCLNKGHTDKFSGKISGDDSTLIFGEHQAKLYSKKAHHFLNEIGLVRKDISYDEPSRIIPVFEDIDFCSHQYVPITYGNGKTKYMPTRPFAEIVGKSMIMLNKPKDQPTQEAWARVQGLNILVNYHHIPEAKALALAILSATRDNISLEGLTIGYKIGPRPWITQGDALQIIKNCLFGDSTTITSNKSPDSLRWKDLGIMKMYHRQMFVNMKPSVRKKWYENMDKVIRSLRIPGESLSYINWHYNFVPTTPPTINGSANPSYYF